MAQRRDKLQGPQPPGILEQAPPWSALGVHQCCPRLCPQDLSLGPASGAENPVGPLPVVPQVTQGGWAGGASRAGLGALLQGAFRMETLVTVLIIEIWQDEEATPLGTGTHALPLQASVSLSPATSPLSLLLLGSTTGTLNLNEGKCHPQSPSASPISRPS